MTALLNLGLLGNSNNYKPKDAAYIFLNEFLKNKDVKDFISWFDKEDVAIEINSYAQKIVFRKKSAINNSAVETY